MQKSIRLKTTLSLLVISCSIFAQNTSTTNSKDSVQHKKTESQKMKTLFSDSKTMKLKSWGVSMSPIAQFGQIGQQRGFNFAFHANNKWAIGITHLQNVRKRRDDMNGNCNCVIMDKPETAFTALSLEYTAKSNSILHVSFPLLIGSIVSREQNKLIQPAYIPNPNDPRMDHHMDNHNDFRGPKSLGIQAGVNLELNIFKYAKLFSGFNYRFAAGRNSTQEMEGISGTVGLKLGLFDQKMGKKKK